MLEKTRTSPELRDSSALFAALDEAETRCGFSLAPLREVAEVVAASSCAFDEARLCFYKEKDGRAKDVSLEFWIHRNRRVSIYVEVLCEADALSVEEATRFYNIATFDRAESDKCAAFVIARHAHITRYE